MKSIAINYLSQAWVALMGIVFVPIYIRFLGSESYGLIGFFVTLSIVMHTISMGVIPTLTREMTKFGGNNETNKELKNLKYTFEILSVMIALLMALSFYGVSGEIAKNWLGPNNIGKTKVELVVKIMGVIIACRLIESIYRSCLIGIGCITSFASIVAAIATVRGLGAIYVLKITNGDIVSFFIWNLATTIVTIISLRFIVNKKLNLCVYKAKFNIVELIKLKSFLGGMMLVSATSTLFNQADKIILSGLMPLTEYGDFTIATTLASVVFMAVSPLSQAIFPKISKAYFENDKKFLELYVTSLKLVTTLTAPLAFTMAINSSVLLKAWTGRETDGSSVVSIFIILCMSSMLNSLSWIPQQAQFAKGKTQKTILINTVFILIIVVFTNITYKFFGIETCVAILALINLAYAAYFWKGVRGDVGAANFAKINLEVLVAPMLTALIVAYTAKQTFQIIDINEIYAVIISGVVTLFFALIASGYHKFLYK